MNINKTNDNNEVVYYFDNSYDNNVNEKLIYNFEELNKNSILIDGEKRENKIEISQLYNSRNKKTKIKDMFSYIFNNVYNNQGPDSAISKL